MVQKTLPFPHHDFSTIPTCRAVRLGRPKAARHATRPKRQGLHGLTATWDTRMMHQVTVDICGFTKSGKGP